MLSPLLLLLLLLPPTLSLPPHILSATLSTLPSLAVSSSPPDPPNCALDFGGMVDHIREQERDKGTDADAVEDELLRAYRLHCDACRDYFLGRVEQLPTEFLPPPAGEGGAQQGGGAAEELVEGCREMVEDGVGVGTDGGREEWRAVGREAVEGLERDVASLAADAAEAAAAAGDGPLDPLDLDPDPSSSLSPRRAKLLRVSKRFLSKAAVIALNYLQTRLALAAARRVAAEGDRDVPKFPLL